MSVQMLRIACLAVLACVGVIAACASNGRNSGMKGGESTPIAAEASDAPQLIGDTRVMTFNIRYAGGDKGVHAWERRRDAVAECIEADAPDIIGLQEVEAVQADWLRARFPGYAFHGVGRIDGERRGEFAPIFYRAGRYELLASGHFWISTTPDVPGSKSWGTACERMASWVRLLDRTTQVPLVVINTHLDHVSEDARAHGVEMIRARAERMAHEPGTKACAVIVTGDFNTSADGELAKRLCRGPRDVASGGGTFQLVDAYRMARSQSEDEASFNGWKAVTIGHRIDWIFTTPGVMAVDAVIDRRTPGGVMASDHYPVAVTLLAPGTRRESAK